MFTSVPKYTSFVIFILLLQAVCPITRDVWHLLMGITVTTVQKLLILNKPHDLKQCQEQGREDIYRRHVGLVRVCSSDF